MPAMTKAELVAEIGTLRKSLSREVTKRERLEQRCAAKIRRLMDAVTEAREQQTATSEILRAISSTPMNVQPVFDAIAESSVRLCNAFALPSMRVQQSPGACWTARTVGGVQKTPGAGSPRKT